jgi:hypothetical protein
MQKLCIAFPTLAEPTGRPSAFRAPDHPRRHNARLRAALARQMKSIRALVEKECLIGCRASPSYQSGHKNIYQVNVNITLCEKFIGWLQMQFEITTSEAAEVFSISKKTVCEYSKLGIFEKISHGKYNLKNSLRNYVIYQKVLREGYDNPMLVWSLRMDEIWKEEERQARDGDVKNIESLEFEDLEEEARR